ncbi:porin [Vibrio ostreae]|uniref:Porin n=1 Tax=Vibrio ostreae TaxID=2841925 RepID=A0A975YPP4_9VIBR|nr:porin [Vibrio ostreae]QXO19067.1 porin [Vibrio ostreae]
MKKTLLALAVMAAAGSANAAEVYKTDDATVDFYGQLREYVEFSDVDGDDDAKIDKSSSRWGVNLSYQAAQDLAVLGNVEMAVEGGDLRTHYIGFSNDSYGTVTFGQHNPLYDDIYGAIYAYNYDMGPYASEGFGDNFYQSSSINYQISSDAAWLKAQYNLPENDSNPEMGEAYVGTAFGDLAVHVGGAFMSDKTGAETDPDLSGIKNVSNDYDATYVEATAEYYIGSGVIGLTYAYNKADANDQDFKVESNSFHLGAKFEVVEKTSVYGNYQYWDFDGDTDETQNIILGVDHIFAKWARVYAEYNFKSQEGKDDANKLALGARVYW